MVAAAARKSTTRQRMIGEVSTHCAGCAGYRQHSLWKETGRGGRYVLHCNDCAHERELPRGPKGSNGIGYKKKAG